jgi:hypothetical protein
VKNGGSSSSYFAALSAHDDVSATCFVRRDNDQLLGETVVTRASSLDFSLVIERAGAMSSKRSICILFEDPASEKQTVFFKQCLFSLQPTV